MIVWISSYPRSGSTLLRIMVHTLFHMKSWSIYGDYTDIGADEDLRDLVGHEEGVPDRLALEHMRRSSEIHLIKTHGRPAEDFRDGDQVIYVLRDGRDVIASYYHYIADVLQRPNVTVEDVVMGRTQFGLWAAHYADWRRAAAREFHLLRFERMVSDTIGTIDRLGTVLKRRASDADLPSFETLQAANPKFFRKGQYQAWQSDFSDADHHLFWLLHGSVMAETGYMDAIPMLLRNSLSRAENRRALDQIRNQIDRTSFLERENNALRHELFRLSRRFDNLRNHKLIRWYREIKTFIGGEAI